MRKCSQHVDAKGRHSLICKVGGHDKAKHNHLRDVVGELFTSAGYNVRKERLVPEWMRRVRRTSRTLARHGRGRTSTMRVELARLDLQIEHPPDDPLAYGDVVVIHPNVSSHQSRAARRDGGAAMIAEAGKRRRYPADRLSRGRLVPLAFEAY